MINKGTPFKGEVSIKISAVEDPNIKFEKRLKFTENNSWNNNALISFLLEFNWPKGLCLMLLHCNIDPENKVDEINEDNNVARIQVFPQENPSLWIMNHEMYLESGKSLRTVKGMQLEPIRIDSVNDVSLGFGNISLNLKFYELNCSSKINTYKPKLKYIDKDCKEVEKELGPFKFNPGEGGSIETELLNGGTVGLSKGDWTWFYRNEYFIEFLVRLPLKAKEPYETRLIIKTIVVDWVDLSFTNSKEVKFEKAESYIELIETVKMWPVPYAAKNILKNNR